MKLYVVWATRAGMMFFEQAQEFRSKEEALDVSSNDIFNHDLGIYKPARFKTVGGDHVSVVAVDHISVLTEEEILQYPRSITGHPDGREEPGPHPGMEPVELMED